MYDELVPSSSDASIQQEDTPQSYTEQIIITCDGCEKNDITAEGGVRYKCLTCHDYELCEECHASDVATFQHSAEHIMQKLTEPLNAVVQYTQVEEEPKPSSSTARSKQTPEHILQERAAKSLSKSTTKKSSKPLDDTERRLGGIRKNIIIIFTCSLLNRLYYKSRKPLVIEPDNLSG